MMFIKSSIIAFSLFASLLESSGELHNLKIFYSDAGHLETTNKIPAIPDFKHNIVCTKASWIIYPEIHYEVPTPRGEPRYEILGLNGCKIETNISKIRSAQPIGDEEDNMRPSVTLFEDSFYGKGHVHVMTKDSPTVPFSPQSIIYINTPVQFYSEPEFKGRTYCFHPIGETCQISFYKTVCSIGLWKLSHQAPFDLTTSKSIKIGCDVKN